MGRQLLEWAGGQGLLPGYVLEDEPFRPEVLLWCEAPHGLIVGSEVVDPRRPVSFAASLEAATARPMVGPPRCPGRVRVARPDLAAEIRAKFPGIEVIVAPTREVDEAISELSHSMRGDSPESDLDGGRIPEAAVARLFCAAGILWSAAPWKRVSDDQVLRVEVPSLGVRGACLSIIGTLGESFGFLLFPSLAGFEAFAELADSPKREPLDLGTGFLSFDFERGADLDPSLRREVSRHDWPVAAPDAHPRLRRVDQDTLIAPLGEKDYRLAAAVATSLVAFFAKRGTLPDLDRDFEPISESWFDNDGLEVRFTYPYEAFELFEPEAAPPSPPATATGKIGRNQPCPCGSGKKYKKCCLEKSGSPPPDARARCHELDERLVTEMIRYARRTFPESWEKHMTWLRTADESLQLAVPLALYGFAVEGRAVVNWFLEEQRRSLTAEERSWLEAQRRSWLSVWEVAEVEPGTSVTLVDLLSGEERRALEASGSKQLAHRDTVLGRVVDHDGISVFCGMHSRPLSPLHAGDVVEAARKRLRRQGPVPVERLREEKVARYLIERWEEAVVDLDELRQRPLTLANTDGDPILLTVDHFVIAPGDRAEVIRRIVALDGVDAGEEGGEQATLTFVGSPKGALENPILGHLEVLPESLRLRTNSVRRADNLRARLETACAGLIRHRAREHTDPRALLDRDEEPSAPRESEIPADVQARLVRDFKEKHYARWIDEPVPALDGETPREAARTQAGRRRVDTLLKDMENHEARLPEAERFDFSSIRSRLGLPR